MKKKFSDEAEILKVVEAFENAAVSRGDWKHAEHITVGVYYLTRNDLKTATDKIRDGIFNLLRKAFDVDLTKEMPYHETLTVFWMRAMAGFLRGRETSSLLENTNDAVELFDKEYPLKFYSREYLFSDEARARFVEPDIMSAGHLPKAEDQDHRSPSPTKV